MKTANKILQTDGPAFLSLSKLGRVVIGTIAGLSVVLTATVVLVDGWTFAFGLTWLPLSVLICFGAGITIARMPKTAIIAAMIALLPIAVLIAWLMNEWLIGPLGWDSDGFLGFYVLLWLPLVALSELLFGMAAGVFVRAIRSQN